ncbi:MAG TPA: pilus assembly protein PilM [Usitatibacter sp.]|nr:pilus assembly protein PilM [Usitatibacter sp.]
MSAKPETAMPRDASMLRQKAESFWRWWTAELAGMLPERLAMLGGGDRAPMIVLEDGDAVVVGSRLQHPGERASLTGLDEARRKAAVRALLERAGESRMRARAVLEPGEVLVRRATMPLATEENLRQVLSFEMDRLTPLRAEEVYFDYRIVSRDAAAGQVAIQLAVARREVVDARVAALVALGLSVQGVALRDEAGATANAFDLLPSEQRGERSTARERLTQQALGVGALLLFLVALGYPLYVKREAVVALEPQVGKARVQAEQTSKVADELDRMVADYNFLLARKYGNYPVLAFIEELSKRLPDNTWVQQMDVRTVGKTREVQIVGETASASKLIEILEGSSVLQNAAFRGTVTRGSVPGTERFMIAAEARSRVAPEMKPVMDVVAAMPAAAPARVAAPAAPAPATPAGAPEPAPATLVVTPAGTVAPEPVEANGEGPAPTAAPTLPIRPPAKRTVPPGAHPIIPGKGMASPAAPPGKTLSQDELRALVRENARKRAQGQ